MGRFLGLSRNRGAASPVEDISPLQAGSILTNDGENAVWAAGARATIPLPTTINANYVFSDQVTATSALNTSFTFAADSLPAGLSINSSGLITGTMTAPAPNPAVLRVRVTDSTFNKTITVTFSFTVDATNSQPVWTTASTITRVFTGSETIAFPIAATAASGTISYAITNLGTLPTGTTINSSTGLITLANFIADGVARTFTFTATATTSASPGTPLTRAFTANLTIPQPVGQATFVGSYGQASGTGCTSTWVAPAGVTRVSVLAIGGGGGGCYAWANCGGAGGALMWANDIPVVPGQSYTVRAGNGGCWDGGCGGFSCWPGMCAAGGCCGCGSGLFYFNNPGATGTCCGGFGMVAYPSTAGGGGGGGGYCNGCCNTATPGYVGMGGGGGSGASVHSSTFGSGGGGGTGICGMGANGTCGNAGYGHQSGSGGGGGSGGTCGNPGEPWSNGNGNGFGCGGTFGGGGGGGGTSHGGGWGGPGAVRIIWGAGRCWPCTLTTNQ